MLKGKKLIVHFDGKLVRQLEEENDLTVTCERAAVSGTSPDLECRDDFLLGIVQAKNSTGSEQGNTILNLLEYYDIVDNIIVVCCDTAAFLEHLQSYQLSLILVLSGAYVITMSLKLMFDDFIDWGEG